MSEMSSIDTFTPGQNSVPFESQWKECLLIVQLCGLLSMIGADKAADTC